MEMLVKRFCFQRFVMALLKLSPPGMIILSPTVSPEMEVSSASSRYFVPVMRMPAMVNSRGDLALNKASNSGSTDVGFVESGIWAVAVFVIRKKQKVNNSTQIGNRRSI